MFAGSGMVTKTTLDNTTTAKITAMVSAITVQAKSVVRDLDPVNDLKFLRMRSNRTEILIAPGIGSSHSLRPDKEMCYVQIKITS